MAKPKTQSRWGRGIPADLSAPGEDPKPVDRFPQKEQCSNTRAAKAQFFRGARIRPK